MQLKGFPGQYVQKQLDNLCLVTPSHKSGLIRSFVSTHRAVCDRIWVKMAPKTDKEKAFSCETVGTVLGVVYYTVTWSWNLNPERLKGILHELYDMHESQSVTNELAMKVSGKVAHCGPLFLGSRWWRKPLTCLPDHDAGRRKLLVLTSCAKSALRWWIMMLNHLRLGILPILDPFHIFPSWQIPIFSDASGVHMQSYPLRRGGGIYLPNGVLWRMAWPGNRKWVFDHGHSMTLLESVVGLQGFLTALLFYGRNAFRCVL